MHVTFVITMFEVGTPIVFDRAPEIADNCALERGNKEQFTFVSG